MASPGTIRFVEINTTPAAPPVGSAIVYIKTDNVIYLQDSSGVEVPLGTASGITSLTGEATGTGPGAATITLSNSAVIGKVLTGYTAGVGTPVLATDTILQAIQKLQAQIGGSSGISTLTGDVTASGYGSVAATVAYVGGSSAANVHSAELLANAATTANTSSTIVKRDASGNFTAGTITANLTGNASTSTSAGSFSGSLSGDVTGIQASTTVATVGGKAASAVATSVDDTVAATSINTASTIIKRDASGNFAANIVTAALTGVASGNELPITATTSADYYRGDKTFQPLNKATVGLSNVVNSDTTTTANITDSSNKRFVTDAEKTVIGNTSGTNTGDQDISGLVPNTRTVNGHALTANVTVTQSDVGLSNVDNTSDANKPVSTAQQIAIDAKVADAINNGTTTIAPSQNAVFDALALKQDSIGFTAENVANKATDLLTPDNTKYPTTLAVSTGLGTKEPTITATTSADYYRGDKTFQTLNKAVVGLSNVVNSDTTTTANITDSSNKRFVTDANLVTIGNQSGTNTGDQTATTVSNTPAGNIAAVTVQAAINELDSEKLSKAGDTMSGYFRSSVVTLTDAATIAVDASLGNIFKVTLGGNRTLGTPSNPLDGQRITFQVTQDGTGGRTLAYTSAYSLGIDMTGISLSTSANATDYIGAIYRSATSTWNIIAISRGY